MQRSSLNEKMSRRHLGLMIAGLTLGATKANATIAASPVGLWRYVDRETGRNKADIRVTEQNGELVGVVETPYAGPGDTADRVCDKCPGTLKGHPFQGLTIMYGLHPDGDSWSGGTIIDAESGTVYKCSVTPLPDGKHLKVRGFVGISLFGRTETWTRVE